MEISEPFRNVKGICDITEDGCGGFTMDSVYFSKHSGEKHVTSIFRLKSEVDSDEEEWEEVCKEEWKNEEKGKWKPGSFDFKAAIGISPSKNRPQKEVPEGIKEAHCLNKTGSKRSRRRTSKVKKHLDEAFGDVQSGVLEEVTNILDKGNFDYLNECLQEKHGVKCDCSLSAREVEDLYSSQGISLISDPSADEEETKRREENRRMCEEYVEHIANFCEPLNPPEALVFEKMKREEIIKKKTQDGSMIEEIHEPKC